MSVRPLRVLYLDHGAKPSGAEFALLRLVEVLDRSKVTPIVVFGSDGVLVEAMRAANVETHVIPLTDKVREIRKDTLHLTAFLGVGRLAHVAAYAARIAAFARRNKIDVIHTNTIKAHFYGGLAARLAGVKLIWHVRDFVNQTYFPAAAVHIFRALARVLPDRIFTVSRGVLEQLHLGKRDVRASVVLDGLTEEELAPWADSETRCKLHAPPRIGIVGRIAKWKGQHVFLDAAAKVLKSGHDAEFHIVGAPLFGEVEYEEGLRKQVEQLGIGSHVRFRGFIKEVAQVIRELDVIVHASISGEPFGQVIIEGMAAGKPVVASRGGGVPEIVEHGVNGLLTPMGDADALASELISLLDDPAKRRRIADAGYEHVRRNFSEGHAAREVERIYGELGGKRLENEACRRENHPPCTASVNG